MLTTSEREKSNQEAGPGIRARLLKGIGAQGFSQSVQIFIRLAEVPLLLGYWGTQLYGEWLMLAAIPSYLSIADGGFAGAACREMTMRSGAGDRNGTLVVFQSTWILLMVVSVIAVPLASGFVHFAPLGDWLGFSAITAIDAKKTLFLLILFVLVGFQIGLLNGGFWVAGCYSKGMYFIALTQVLEFGGIAAAVSLGGGPIQAASGYLCGRLLGTGIMWFGQRRVCPWLHHGLTNASFAELRRLTAPAIASLSFPIGNALNIQGMRLVVGVILGPSAVALFVPMRTLSRIVMQPASIVNRLVEPELALSHGAKDNSLFKRLFTKSCQITLWGCLGASLFVGPSAHWIFSTWTNGKIELQWPTFIILLGGVVINSLWYTALMASYAINRHGRIAMCYVIVYGIAAFGFGFLGATSWGLGGVAIVLLLTEATMAVIVVRPALQMSGVKFSQWASTIMRPPVDIFGFNSLFRRIRMKVSS
ncbi:lipopolysaccharide biosynthesis protein [Desulfosarcina widdelii]|uniref:lipopolysaccharide biosynthesis protein n=1 Tax=Desulfosarcina widdelii TaxID=947919 RepID=UPI0012D34393|nr:hypothetical protein [Desulfosarcina widdelii]